jgi:glutaredoxin-related protein
VLLELTGKRGFSSEYARWIRAVAVARFDEYEVLVDPEFREGRWVYGELSE